MAEGIVKLSAGVIIDQHIKSSAGIDADKMQHVHKGYTNFGLEYNAAPAAKVFVVYTATAAGTIRGFHCGCYDTGTSSSITFDLKKNGTTCLSGVVTITHAETDRVTYDGTLSVTTFVADDVFTIHLAQSSTTGMTGPYAWADFEENAAP
jgi:hypothetical protein